VDTVNRKLGRVSDGGVKSFVLGLLLALFLTVIPFIVVMASSAPRPALIVAFGIAQIIVHAVFFLYVNGSAQKRRNVLLVLFSALVIVVIVAGSMWIMRNPGHHMLPMPISG
jgi:cytochrome o ubiquinol oxidase subunit IV